MKVFVNSEQLLDSEYKSNQDGVIAIEWGLVQKRIRCRECQKLSCENLKHKWYTVVLY